MNSSEIQKRFGENLRFIRKQKKLTQFQLAELANVSEDTIKSIEQGRTWFSEKVLSQITEALNVIFQEAESNRDRIGYNRINK